MVQKRPFVEEFSGVPFKHSKLEHGCQLIPFLEFPFLGLSRDQYSSDLGKTSFSKCTTESHVKLESGKISEFSVCPEKDTDTLQGVYSNSSWFINTEGDVKTEVQGYCPVKPRRVIKQPEDAYSYLMERPPQKLVPIGPDFQADIPEWRGHHCKNMSTCSGFVETLISPQPFESDLKVSVDADIKHIGNCVVPLPEMGPVSCNRDNVGNGRTDCCCEDRGSVRCVRQHVREARVNLRRTVGLKRFYELGLDDMGETVAEKWTAEDEELFQDVVFSNPASLEKNFWHRLAAVFPCRTSYEIVSYYFNVFMLRKRAAQNKSTPADIDSDNDEWEGSNESEDEAPYQNEICGYDSYDRDGVDKSAFNDHDKQDFCGFEGMTSVLKTWPMSSNASSQCSEKTLGDEMGAYEFQEDSGMTFDAISVPQVSQEKVEDGKHWGHDRFNLEPCDLKVCDTEYFSFLRAESDFLPTYSVIEQVLGVEYMEKNSKDDGKP